MNGSSISGRWRMAYFRSHGFFGVFLLASLFVASPAVAQNSIDSGPEAVCPAPISTCGGEDGVECPTGYQCACVPSCPACRDCAAQVCVPAPSRECHTACDCEPGYGCFEGQCLAGFAPVYCCDRDPCPAGEECQHRDGGRNLCQQERECRSTCDCEPGLACRDGRCIAEILEVFCCESDRCPAGRLCEHKDGSEGQCTPQRECRSACDCEPGLGCFDGQCVAGFAPIFCCESDRCPVGQQCQHEDGRPDACKDETECKTACDCKQGLGCVEGQCVAGIVPVLCCEADGCPTGEQCQHRDGRFGQCSHECVNQLWLCDSAGDRACGEGRVCSCSASCPFCEDCGPNVCVPEGSPTPYRCNSDGGCSQAGDRCVCVSSCPECDDCALNLCVPGCDTQCDRRRAMAMNRIERVVEHTRPCLRDTDCVRVDTTTGCQGTCGMWVHKRFAERVQKFVEHVDQRYCSEFRADGCTYVGPRCQGEVGACIRGECVGQPFPRPEQSAQRRDRNAR